MSTVKMINTKFSTPTSIALFEKWSDERFLSAFFFVSLVKRCQNVNARFRDIISERK